MIGGKERVPVAIAAKILGMTPLTVQESLKVKALPIGGAWKNEGSTCWTFHISPHLLAQYIGATDEELRERMEKIQVANVQQEG